LLYLHKGNWAGKQLINGKLAESAVTSPLPNELPRTQGQKAEMIAGQRSIGGGNNQTDHLGSYSFAWWTNGVDRSGKRHWTDAPVDTFGAFGHGGKRATVIMPTHDIVVSWNDANIKNRDMPAARAASTCSRGKLRIAARQTSALNAAVLRISVMRAAV
jgi:hypothetical protein